MEQETIKNLLTNSGLQNVRVENGLVYFTDPSCVFTAFDKILDFAWIVIAGLTVFLLFGWAVLYIKNGTKIDTVFNNAKSLILVFCVLSVVKPAVNLIWGGDLFGKQCETKHVSYDKVQELLDMRKKNFKQSDDALLYESFSIVDSGAKSTNQTQEYNNTYNSNKEINPSVNTAPSTSLENNDVNYSVNTESTASNVVSIERTPTMTIYITADGKRTAHIGGSVTWQNNNPGAMRANSAIAKKLGAVDASGKWMVFPSEQAGLNAIVKLLHSKNYINLSVKDAIHRWAPFGDGNNNPDSYSKKIAKLTGLSPDAILRNLSDNDMQKIANAIKQIEGWRVGKKQVM